MKKSSKKLIGRSDIADFPLLDLGNIDIKIDTGAYTSSIHCKNIVEENNVLVCEFLDPEHSKYNGKKFTFTNYDIKSVKSSNGQSSLRYSIETIIILFQKEYPITLTLNSRDDMRFPILIGRKFLKGGFIVDTEYTNLSSNPCQEL